MPTYIPGEGTTLGISATSGGTYATIPNLKSVTPPPTEVPDVDITLLTSTTGESRPGKIPKPGEMTFVVQYDPTNETHQEFTTLIYTPGYKYFRITFAGDGQATNAYWQFMGFVRNFEHDEIADETNLQATITVKVSGPITFNEGAAS